MDEPVEIITPGLHFTYVNSAHDLITSAIHLEQDGETWYRQLAGRSSSPGIKQLLLRLAADEVNHRNILETLRDQTAPEDFETSILQDARIIFLRLRETETHFHFDEDFRDQLKRALAMESRCETFYRNHAEPLDDLCIREVFLKIADEEAGHRFLLGTILLFVESPSQWLEDSGFETLDG